jgi:hypothetical protein
MLIGCPVRGYRNVVAAVDLHNFVLQAQKLAGFHPSDRAGRGPETIL